LLEVLHPPNLREVIQELGCPGTSLAANANRQTILEHNITLELGRKGKVAA